MGTQEEEQAHRKWMETLLNALPTPVIVVELGTARVLYANATALEAIAPEEQPCGIIENAHVFTQYQFKWRSGLHDMHGRKLPVEEYPSHRVARGESFTGYALCWHHPETGEVAHLLCSGAVLPPAHGRPAKGIVCFVNITEQAEQQKRLKDAISIREDFLAVAAHELKTPITSVMLQAQSLLQRLRNSDVPKEEIIKRLELAERATGKLNRLVQELLDVSRITNPRELKFREIDLCEVVREVCARQEPMAKRQNITLRINLPVERVRGNWDLDKLERILINLISNAIKYGCGQPVEIYIEHLNGMAVLCVRDYGIGVPEDARERIFQRFERAVSGDEYAGLGLGLWLAQEAARSLGGLIDVVTPNEGPGSCFRLSLPIENGR